MKHPVVMPRLGATGGDVKIVEWRIAESDVVAAGAALLTVETDKSVVEVEAFRGGRLTGPLAPAGSSVAPGEVIRLSQRRCRRRDFCRPHAASQPNAGPRRGGVYLSAAVTDARRPGGSGRAYNGEAIARSGRQRCRGFRSSVCSKRSPQWC